MSSEIHEDKATRAQIRKLYAVLYNSNIEPKNFLGEKQLESFNQFGKGEISEIIDELETNNYASPPEQQQQQQEEVEEVAGVADVADRIEEKGKVLKKCLDVASRIVAETHTINTHMEEYQKASIIIEIARILFEHEEK